jgi:hypothetical protein
MQQLSSKSRARKKGGIPGWIWIILIAALLSLFSVNLAIKKVAAIIRLRQTIVVNCTIWTKHIDNRANLVTTPIFLVKVSVATQMQHHLLHRLVVLYQW